jgi:hypothetical protein
MSYTTNFIQPATYLFQTDTEQHSHHKIFVSLQPPAHASSSLVDFSTLKMEAIRSSETSVHARSTQRHIPEDDIPYKIFLPEPFIQNGMFSICFNIK